MPTYTYECRKCGHAQDRFHNMSAKPRVKCEECGGSCKKLMGTGSGIIFKGSGFYETDYKDKKGTKPVGSKSGDGKSSESKGSDNKSSGSKSSESKSPDSKSNSSASPVKSGSGSSSAGNTSGSDKAS